MCQLRVSRIRALQNGAHCPWPQICLTEWRLWCVLCINALCKVDGFYVSIVQFCLRCIMNAAFGLLYAINNKWTGCDWIARNEWSTVEIGRIFPRFRPPMPRHSNLYPARLMSFVSPLHLLYCCIKAVHRGRGVTEHFIPPLLPFLPLFLFSSSLSSSPPL